MDATTIDSILADVTGESTLIDSVSAFITSLKQQLKDALAGQIDDATKAKIDQIFATAEQNKARLADALAANTAVAAAHTASRGKNIGGSGPGTSVGGPKK